jgi:predicted DNA-binding protein (MmcQ/YjbR family)
MNYESVREFCLGLPHATEEVLWGNDLVFKIGGKMFACLPLEPSPAKPIRLTFKCTPEDFAEFIEREGIIPAPYAARHHWIALESFDLFTSRELERLLKLAYELVRDKLPKKLRATLSD